MAPNEASSRLPVTKSAWRWVSTLNATRAPRRSAWATYGDRDVDPDR